MEEEEGSEFGPEEVSCVLTRNIFPSRRSMKKQSEMDEAVSTRADENTVRSFGQTGASAQAHRERRSGVVAKSIRSGKTDEAPKCTAPLNLALDETTLFTFVHKVNEVYRRYLQKSMPFVRYVLSGCSRLGNRQLWNA